MMKYVSCLIGALFCLCSSATHAFPIVLEFKGEVTSTLLDPLDPFAGVIAPGTSLLGFYTFESTTPDAVPDPNIGSYSNFGAPFGMEVGIGGVNFAASEFLNIGVANNIGASVDQYTVLAQQGQPFVDPEAVSLQLFFEDPTGAVFNGDELPLTPPSLTSFAFGSFFLDAVRTATDGTIFQIQIQGSITTLVPEPTSALLFVIGLASLGFARSSKQRRSAIRVEMAGT